VAGCATSPTSVDALATGGCSSCSGARTRHLGSGSESGHLAEQKEDRGVLGKWGNDLRQTFRTLATAAGVSEFDARLLINHAIPGVNAGYISRHKLLEDHLRIQQQAISATMFNALGDLIAKDDAVGSWLGPCATRRAIQVAKRNDGEALRDEYNSSVFVLSGSVASGHIGDKSVRCLEPGGYSHQQGHRPGNRHWNSQDQLGRFNVRTNRQIKPGATPRAFAGEIKPQQTRQVIVPGPKAHPRYRKPTIAGRTLV